MSAIIVITYSYYYFYHPSLPPLHHHIENRFWAYVFQGMLLFLSTKGRTGQEDFSNSRILNSFSLRILTPEKA